MTSSYELNANIDKMPDLNIQWELFVIAKVIAGASVLTDVTHYAIRAGEKPLEAFKTNAKALAGIGVGLEFTTVLRAKDILNWAEQSGARVFVEQPEQAPPDLSYKKGRDLYDEVFFA